MPGKAKKSSQKKQKTQEEIASPEEQQDREVKQAEMREDETNPTDVDDQEEAQPQSTTENTESKNAGGSTRELSVEQESVSLPQEIPALTPTHSIDPVPEDEVNKVEGTDDVHPDSQCALTSPTNNIPTVPENEDEEQLTEQIPDTHSNKYHREDTDYLVPVSPRPTYDAHTTESQKIPSFAHQKTQDMDNLPILESETQGKETHLSNCHPKSESLWHEPSEPKLNLETTQAYKAAYYSWLQLKLGYLFITRTHRISE